MNSYIVQIKFGALSSEEMAISAPSMNEAITAGMESMHHLWTADFDMVARAPLQVTAWRTR